MKPALRVPASVVLVIDDNDASRYILVHLLRKSGFEALEAANGADGLKMAESHPDLIIIDVNLPDINGTELARMIKADPGNPGCMVLNISASFTRTRDRIQALDCGADGFLTQPIDPPEFIATVRSLMRIRKAEESVRRANLELSQFAYVASHDLQEPLRTVSSFLGIFRERYADRLDERGLSYIDRAIAGSGRLSTMIHDLLAFSQTEGVALEMAEIDLALSVRDALDNLAVKIKESGATVICEALPRVMGHRNLLTQVFQNLISNAVKFRSQNPPLIRIGGTTDGDAHLISIQDNGIGIAEPHLKKIFGIFQRLHGADQYPGSGIGLSVCRRIIELHGGTVGVTSIEGEGSCFWFSMMAQPQ